MGTGRPPKRERTRARLIAAGLEALAEHGESLTASDVAQRADVANGTFYNYFDDREDFLRALAVESLEAIVDASAEDTDGSDPAWRFAVATTRVLRAGIERPVLATAVLRLADHPDSPHIGLQRHLRADLATGLATGRFTYGDDRVTIDIVSGTILATLRRIAAGAGETSDITDVVSRLLELLGMDRTEAHRVADDARLAG